MKKKKLVPHKKIFVVRVVYTMENKDANTDCHKFAMAGNQKWEIVETTIGIFFFFFAWESHSLFFI